MILVVLADQFNLHGVINQERERFQAVVTLAYDGGLSFVHKWVVVLRDFLYITSLLIDVEEVAHHHESIHKLSPDPDVLLLGVQIVHLHLDVVVALLELEAREVNIDTLVSRVVPCETKREVHVLFQLLGDLVRFVNHRFDLASQRVNFELVGLLAGQFSLFGLEVGLLLINLPAVISFFVFHGDSGQFQLILSVFQLLLSLD